MMMVRRHLTPVLLFSGIAVLGYAGFQYGVMLFEQRHLQSLWRDQQRLNRVSPHQSRVAFQESVLTRISIPRIGFSAVVVEGTDLFSLMVAPGHLPGTAQPGEPGNSVISAHRDTFFRDIAHVSPGDQIVVERDGRTFTYAVEGIQIVQPNDISVTAPTHDSRLTLITCDPAYYPGPAPHRLVITSRLLTQFAPSPSVAGMKHSSLAVKTKKPRRD